MKFRLIVLRGGCWGSSKDNLDCVEGNSQSTHVAGQSFIYLGFRIARNKIEGVSK